MLDVLLDGELAGPPISAFSLVNTSIGTAADEADDLVALVHPLLVVVSGEHGLSRICRLCPPANSVLAKTTNGQEMIMGKFVFGR
jgi:hypothetical protein